MPTNSRPPAFLSLTQCQPEDLKFCPSCLFLILGSGPAFPFPDLTLPWLWNCSWDGRFTRKAPGEQGPAAETCDSCAAPWLHGPPLPPCCFFLLLCHLATFSPFLAFSFTSPFLPFRCAVSLLSCFSACFYSFVPHHYPASSCGPPHPCPFCHLSPSGIWPDLNLQSRIHCSLVSLCVCV